MTTWSEQAKNSSTWSEVSKAREEHYLLRETGDIVLRESGDYLLIEDLKTSWGNNTKNTTTWKNLTKN